MSRAAREVVTRLARLSPALLLCASAWADEPIAPPPLDEQSPAVVEATHIGIALGAAQRCGMAAQDLATMRKLALERLQTLTPDKAALEQVTGVMQESERYGATEMQKPAGGCTALLMVTSSVLGRLAYVVAHAELDVPDLRRASPLENFGAWAGQLAVMASHCGAADRLVNKAATLSTQYIARQAPNQRVRMRADAELSSMMMQAEFEDWGDRAKCTEILTTFGRFLGNLESRLQN
ncbi:MAG TPA: hypothetical protein VMH26_06925 [Burkholderiales bacterium]|nr:hypothetical protein [Burkholderiales bacterium]